ncbi:hypothetical protein CAPGI0001_1368 [Capnocytophaga gingivalis ATCC 33624]|nr:hypothetical protein CAPGI0001_1368 [Capnocytophaga gingivalis ATCC 33624]
MHIYLFLSYFLKKFKLIPKMIIQEEKGKTERRKAAFLLKRIVL